MGASILMADNGLNTFWLMWQIERPHSRQPIRVGRPNNRPKNPRKESAKKSATSVATARCYWLVAV